VRAGTGHQQARDHAGNHRGTHTHTSVVPEAGNRTSAQLAKLSVAWVRARPRCRTGITQGSDLGQTRRLGRASTSPPLVVQVRGRGLVVLTGRGHAGAVNIGRHAQRLTVVSAVAALVDGLHLSGPAFEPVIGPTVDALPAMAPGLVAPGQCTGWRAQHALVAALPTPGPPAAPDRRYCVHGA